MSKNRAGRERIANMRTASTKYLITGGAGFIGGWLVRQLLTERPQAFVINLDKLAYAGSLESISDLLGHSHHKFIRGDLSDSQLVTNILTEYHPTVVIHAAAESHVDRSIDNPIPFVATNVRGTVTLLESTLRHWQRLPTAEKEIFRFVQVSTDEVFGSLGPTGAFNETSKYGPRSPYAASKAAADHFTRAYHHSYGLPVIVTHCSNNYGPCQYPEKLIPLMILNAVDNIQLPVYGDGGHIRDWIHVEDHCRALRLVADHGIPGETYNIGANCQRTNLAVVEMICDLVDAICPTRESGRRRRLIQFVADRPGHDRRYAINARKIRVQLGWRPQHPFDVGLGATVSWYLGHADWVEHITSGKYRRNRLGLGERIEDKVTP